MSPASVERLYAEGLVPLVISVTGHRDLVAAEVPRIRELLGAFFEQLRARFPDRPLQILSALAEGSDRLVAEVALAHGVRLAVPLPMPKHLYILDFETEESRQEFERLCADAHAVYELPIAEDATDEDLRQAGDHRDRQYARLGVFLCAHCHLLLALWDGKPSNEVGGTAQVVRFHHDDAMAGYGPLGAVTQHLLVDDQSDLVYHVVVSRDRPDGAPLAGLGVLSCGWLTTDELEPRTTELPPKYVRIFERTSEFNRDARVHRGRSDAQYYPLIGDEDPIAFAGETRNINRLFCAADSLAIYFQSRMLRAFRVTHALAFVMGLMFILYSDVQARRPFMIGFFLCFVATFTVYYFAARQKWQEKYLEYRALAEGLRVQFYWAVAGVTGDLATKYAHDNFLQKQDVDLVWIRNVMRVAGIGCDVAPDLDAEKLAFVIHEWIGDEKSGGQLQYYRRTVTQYVEKSGQLDRLGRLTGVVVTSILIASVIVASNGVRGFLFAALGSLLLLLSVRQSYAYRIAEKELIKQYEFMYRIFRKARRRLQAASSDAERRRILHVLGQSALEEHAEWILLHRGRPLDRGKLWRMES
ncbi:MAG TPA: hypothetical protein VIC71_06325 [Gammaproteobacteria bacterium]